MVEGPDNTAVRVALWRALHVQLDDPPHVLEDEIGLRLVAPHDNWRERPDMHPTRRRRSRAAIVARTRFIEDLVAEHANEGVSQYVLLGAGLDTFAQRNRALASRLNVFELEQPVTQAWKRARLMKVGFGVPSWLHLVPMDLEAGDSWLDRLEDSGFDRTRPAIVASTGVVMYLTREAVTQVMRQAATLSQGSIFVVSFMLPASLVEPEEREAIAAAARDAKRSGFTFSSLFAPDEILTMAREVGLEDVVSVSAAELTARYFAGRADGLRPSSAEELMVARVG